MYWNCVNDEHALFISVFYLSPLSRAGSATPASPLFAGNPGSSHRSFSQEQGSEGGCDTGCTLKPLRLFLICFNSLKNRNIFRWRFPSATAAFSEGEILSTTMPMFLSDEIVQIMPLCMTVLFFLLFISSFMVKVGCFAWHSWKHVLQKWEVANKLGNYSKCFFRAMFGQIQP